MEMSKTADLHEGSSTATLGLESFGLAGPGFDQFCFRDGL
jgi:hypothetical protein